MTDPLALALMAENQDLWQPGTPNYPVAPRDANSIASIAGARLTDKLQGGADALLSALMAPGTALQGGYDQRPVYADGSVGQFDPRMIEDAATLAGSVSLGAMPIPRPANSVGAGGSQDVNKLLNDVRERRKLRSETLTSILSSNPSSFRLTGGSGDVLAGPDMSKPGGFRLTYFGQDGIPNGHSEFPSLEAALNQALLDGYKVRQ